MREYPNQHPSYPKKDHFEATLSRLGYEDVPRCQCWKTDHSDQCGNPAMRDQDICVDHGGAGVRANKKIQDRKQFQEALADHDDGSGVHINTQLVDQLALLCKKGNLEAIKYWFDQQFGAPKTTIVQQVDSSLMEIIGEVTAPFIAPENFDEWLSSLKSALSQSS